MPENLLFLLIILFSGCSYFTSWDEQSERVLGQQIDLVIRLDGQPDAITVLPDGQKEYKYHLKKLDPSCVHYWIVNEEGIIIGYCYTGYCRPIG